MIYRIYTEDKNREAIIKVADDYLDGYTVFEAQGRFQGVSEASLVIEYIGKESWKKGSDVSGLASYIKGYNQQCEVWIIEIQETKRIVV